jgi:hypothetical protein
MGNLKSIISVTTHVRTLKPNHMSSIIKKNRNLVVERPENSIFQVLAIGFHWFFKLFLNNGFLWENFFLRAISLEPKISDS